MRFEYAPPAGLAALLLLLLASPARADDGLPGPPGPLRVHPAIAESVLEEIVAPRDLTIPTERSRETDERNCLMNARLAELEDRGGAAAWAARLHRAALEFCPEDSRERAAALAALRRLGENPSPAEAKGSPR